MIVPIGFPYTFTNSSGNTKRYDFVDYVEELLKMTGCKSIRKCLRIISNRMKEGQLYCCDGYYFTPLSIFKKKKDSGFCHDTYDIGARRVKEWISILEKAYGRNKLFCVYINPVDEVGVDVLITKNGIPYTVIELTNYGKNSYISYSDVQRYIKSLNQWDKYGCFKVIVVSFARNLKHKNNPRLWEEFVKNNIGIKVMGYQA